ncbi:MAG: CDP-alcohol phosphatidyltransferase family protein [Eggerthellaceae bacterium]|nr:CDP-alcohol phosphatidyltransferase family protein [Eggerthellaceae bacterium]
MAEEERKIDTTSKVAWKGEVSDAIFTVPNVISFARLLLIPLFFILLVNRQTVPAAALYAIAASTDWVDGFIARRTNSVSKLGRILDPAADRLLMIFSVIGLAIVGSLPIWITALVLARDVVMLFGYFIMLRRYEVRVDVILAGKIATALLYIGFFFLIINAPQVPGLGLVDLDWLPGFGTQSASLGIWFVYLGVVLGIFTTAHYAIIGLLACHQVEVEKARSS